MTPAAAAIARLAEGPPLDAVIIGGGINGCGIARELARRGLRVALFEADDFGFGTTWRSTKLIHGGLRYLEHGDLRLVFESLHERARLLRERPHLVRPQRFLLPLLPWTRRPAWQLRAGLALYDLLSFPGDLPAHRRVSAARARELAPGLAEEARGGFTFFDARALAPERLALELALEAEAAGAVVANHAPVTAIRVGRGTVEGVEVMAAGERITLPARAVVNAAGPWVDAVAALAGPAEPLLGVTRGTHIVVDTGGPLPRAAVLSTARSDGRVFFAIPQDGLLLVGTTDDRYSGAPGAARPEGAEADYLLAEARELLPGLGLERASVVYAYTGLRPLRDEPGGPEAAITRRHELIDHARRGGPRGLYSVAGGKLSTFRPLSCEVAGVLGAGARPRESQAPAWPVAASLRAMGLAPRAAAHVARYGPAAAAVVAGGRDVLCPHTGAITGEVAHAVHAEKATTLADILTRRTGVAWGACRGLCCHEMAAALAAPLLGWTDSERQAQVAAFEREVAYHLPGRDSLWGSQEGSCISATTSTG